MTDNQNICRKLTWLMTGVLLCSQAPVIKAGDEDLSPSAYQLFDPETGYMVKVTPPPKQHTPGTPAGNTPGVVNAVSPAVAGPADNASATLTATTPADSNISPGDTVAGYPAYLALLGVLVVAGIGLLIAVNHKRKPDSEELSG
jgi:hypothetical protein